jgi:hypothetical protein
MHGDTTMVKVCEAKQWSGDLRGCLARATTKDRADECVRSVQVDLDVARAEAAAQQAAEDAKVANERVIALQQQLDSNDKELTAAVDAVAAAQSDQERAAAVTKLEDARATKVDLAAQIAHARATATQRERAKGVHISKECLDNPLGSGCV